MHNKYKRKNKKKGKTDNITHLCKIIPWVGHVFRQKFKIYLYKQNEHFANIVATEQHRN